MEMKMYTVYDSKAEAYLNPFVLRSKGEAIRSFQTEANKPDSNLNRYSEDYTLFEIGTFDTDTGIVTSNKIHTALGKAIEFRKDSINAQRLINTSPQPEI